MLMFSRSGAMRKIKSTELRPDHKKYEWTLLLWSWNLASLLTLVDPSARWRILKHSRVQNRRVLAIYLQRANTMWCNEVTAHSTRSHNICHTKTSQGPPTADPGKLCILATRSWWSKSTSNGHFTFLVGVEHIREVSRDPLQRKLID